MKIKITSLIAQLKRIFFEDYLNIYFLSFTVALATIALLIWRLRIRNEDIYVFTLNGVYPIRFLAIILVINTLLAALSYEKEKEITYLLLSANILITLFIITLEIFYLTSLNV